MYLDKYIKQVSYLYEFRCETSYSSWTVFQMYIYKFYYII